MWLLWWEIHDLAFLLNIWWALTLNEGQVTMGVCGPGADLQVVRWLIGCRQDCLYIRIQSRNLDWETVFLAFLNHLYWNVVGDILLLNLFFKPWRLFSGVAVPAHVLSKPMASVSMACSSVLLWLIYSTSQSWTWTWGTNYCNTPPPPEWLYKKHLVYFSFSGLIFRVQVCHMF